MILLTILSNIKQFKYLYILGVYILTLSLFATYYYYSQNQISKLETFKTQYNALVIKYDTDIKYLKDTYNAQLDMERDGFDSYKKQCRSLQNLDKVAKSNPTKAEQIINKAAQKRLDCFEAATGNKDKVNDLCKNYYKK